MLKNKWTKIESNHVTENHQNFEKEKLALQKICPASCMTDPDWLPVCIDNQFFSAAFTLSEFNTALYSKNIHSSRCMDGIDYIIIQNLPLIWKLILIDIFNEMLATSDYPNNWRESYVLFITKYNGKNVRPIYLSSCMCKLLEIMVKNMLQWWVERENIIPNSKSGFRKGQGTYDNLTNLLLNVEEAFHRKNDVMAAFFDVSGTFDSVDVSILLKKLANIGLSHTLIKIIKFITHYRSVYTDITENEVRKVYAGVSQGGVLSPLLYSIYVANIVEGLPKSVKISQFADDIAIYISRKQNTSSLKLLEKSINIIHNKLFDLGLTLCAQKTTFIHFNRNNITPNSTQLKTKDTTINSSPTAKFLGITFDYKLTFKEHINHLQSKCLKALNILKFLRGTW